MQGVLQGFTIVLILIFIGLATARFLPRKRESIATGLTPLIYYITNPALMFTLLADTDLRSVIGVFTPIALITAALTGGLYALCAKLFLKVPAARLPGAAMSTSYVNAGNIGVPLALYAVGSTNPVVSVLIAQLLLIAPVYLCLFALAARAEGNQENKPPLAKTILRSIANPVTIATFVGALFAAFNLRLPEVINIPLNMLGQASIPLLLMAFGMALFGQRPLAEKSLRGEVFLATGFKMLFMPLVAWVFAAFVFKLQGTALLGVVIMAALPTAQNVLLFSQQFRLETTVAREVVLCSTLLALPVTLGITLLLG
ncbi:AEC family transporter [Paeniglutamicibacter sulfureus]|uniref:AEC family transporter n=1 Tax=Paeniglutamicibacter sulfureus TaxID=43666 RepID=UPI002666C56F|nr:AEC family transporter [Paeniglutamicibacter sulfureus]MDO2934697.1 AEC family transporter [Paeniglutamicibacter sulfureus]